MTAPPTDTPKAQPSASENTGPHFGLEVPLMRLLGVEPIEMRPELARTRLPANPAVSNSRGEIHGGALMAVLDFTLGMAARSARPESGAATIEMGSHFLEPARGAIDFEARVLRRGHKTVFVEGEGRDAQGRRVVIARGTFKLLAGQGNAA